MKNQLYTGTSVSRRQVVVPSAVTAGMPILVGTLPGVALDNYAVDGTGYVTVLFNGSFNLPVNAWTGTSPLSGEAVNPGDKLYASGTLDSATNVTYNLTISKHSTDVLFGHLDPTMAAVPSGTTVTTGVVLEAEV